VLCRLLRRLRVRVYVRAMLLLLTSMPPAVFPRQLSSLPSGLRLIDGPVAALNCTGHPYNISHCLDASAASPSDLVLIRTTHSAPAHRPCHNATLELPPQITQYTELADRVWRTLHQPDQPICTWTVGSFVPSSTTDPLLAYVDASKREVLISADLLGLVPATAAPTVTRYYERLITLMADGATGGSLARAFWSSVVAESSEVVEEMGEEASPVPKALECVACIVLGSFASLALANFGGVSVGCYLCGCLSLGTSACSALLHSVLYLVIALLPLIAVVVFEGCKSLCVSAGAHAPLAQLAAQI